MSPMIEPTPGNMLGRGGIAGVVLVTFGGLCVHDSKGDPRVVFFGTMLVLLGAVFFLQVLKALRR